MKLDATDPRRLALAVSAPLALLIGFALWAERGVRRPSPPGRPAHAGHTRDLTAP